MSATFSWSEDNGAATGSPAHGTTTTGSRTEANWKNVDDSTTAYGSAPIAAGNNSYTKYQYGYFSGTFSLISSCLFSLTAWSASLGTGLSVYGTVTSTYATPATTANAALTTNFTTPVAIGSGLAVNFSTTGPYGASPTSTLSATGYSQYCATQMQTSSGTSPGPTATATLTMQYNES
jgi:hypothetical protein